MLIPNPIGQPTTGRFYSRADTNAEQDELTLEEQLKPWHLQDDANHSYFENELDRAQYEAQKSMRKHVAVFIWRLNLIALRFNANLIFVGCV